MTRLLIVAVLSAVALAQDKRTEAEGLFEKAWWEETASGALDKALDGYRKAADAAGPAAIRARSLYRAAIVEQRLGRTDAAVALLERLAKDFAGEVDLLKEAKARLQEWTAVDLRKSFSEWYRSYVYSPEFQARVVDLVLRMGTAKQEESQEAWNQLLTIGEASVPALQEALKGSNSQLCHKATQLLLRLGVVPPTEALVKYPVWTREDQDWLTLYRADEATRRRVREETKGDEPLAKAVRAVATSPEEMLSFARAEPTGRIVHNVLVLLLDHSGDAMRRQVVGLVEDPAVPESVTTFLRGRFPLGPPDVEARKCLDWTRSLTNARARNVAAAWAALKLTEKNEEDLDGVLALVPAPGDAFVSDVAVSVLDALNSPHAATLAWTPARVGTLLDLWTRLEAAGTVLELGRLTGEPAHDAFASLARVLSGIRAGERGASALADALLDRAARLRGSEDNRSRFANVVGVNITVLGPGGNQEWRDLFIDRLIARWPGASLEDRVALLGVVKTDGMWRQKLLAALRDEFAKEAVARGTDPEYRREIASLLGGVRVSGLLASFDLSKPEEAQAAMETLEGLPKNLSRDDRTAAAMGEMLIPATSPVRRRALFMLKDWQSEKDAALLPAAKILVSDDHAEVRLWAVNRLSEWNSFDASPYLVKALADADAEVRTAAAGGLARVGREDAVPALIKLLDDPNPAVREAALAALEQIRKIVEQKKAWQLEQAGLR